jgi:hypothetical protein
MGPTTLPADTEAEEAPKAMLYDGWGFVPLADTDAAVQPEAEITSEPI